MTVENILYHLRPSAGRFSVFRSLCINLRSLRLCDDQTASKRAMGCLRSHQPTNGAVHEPHVRKDEDVASGRPRRMRG